MGIQICTIFLESILPLRFNFFLMFKPTDLEIPLIEFNTDASYIYKDVHFKVLYFQKEKNLNNTNMESVLKFCHHHHHNKKMYTAQPLGIII